MHRKLFIAIGCSLMFLGIFGIAKASFMPIKAIIGQHYLEAAWQESLRNNRLSKPWRSADFYMIGELTVPRLKISRVILNSVSGEAMAWGIGRVDYINKRLTKQPIILAGHRDSHMQFMYDLNIGDKIELMMSDRSIQTYIITKAGITNKPALDIPGNLNKKNSLILTTCWPKKAIKDSGQRYIIFANNQIASNV